MFNLNKNNSSSKKKNNSFSVSEFQLRHFYRVKNLLGLIMPEHRFGKMDLLIFKFGFVIDRIENYLIKKKGVKSLFSSNFDRQSFIAENVENLVAGFISVKHLRGDTWSIQRLSVNPKYRRIGIGSILVETALSYVREKKGKEVLLTVEVSNIAAMSLYRKFGFVPNPYIEFMRLEIDKT